MTILVTAFDAFGGEQINPTALALDALSARDLNIRLHKRLLPTVFHESIVELRKALDEVKPDAVLCLGQAGGRNNITLERVAINLDDARIPDNKNNQPIDEVIFPDGENAYFSTLPIKAIVEHLKEHGIPAEVSNTAGTFVCNHVLYGLLYSTHNTTVRGGFMHVPFLPEQVTDKPSMPSMSLEDITRAVFLTLEAISLHKEDLSISGGKEW